MTSLSFTTHDFPAGRCGYAWLRGVTSPFRFTTRRGYVVLDDFIYSPTEVFLEVVIDVQWI